MKTQNQFAVPCAPSQRRLGDIIANLAVALPAIIAAIVWIVGP